MWRGRELLLKIDIENERAMGPIRFSRNGSNMFMQLLDHRRWLHPDYQQYLRMRRNKALYYVTVMLLSIVRFQRAFKEQYYAPGGVGYLKGKERFDSNKCTFSSH
jgi:hypothetical protein